MNNSAIIEGLLREVSSVMVRRRGRDRILKYNLGIYKFHNFTTSTIADNPSVWGFTVSFEANTTVVVEGMEFVKCEAVGQSFMLHQIWKMIGLAVAIMRNCAPELLMEKGLQKDVNINVPTAHEVGFNVWMSASLLHIT